MPTFKYEIQDASGQVTSGVMQANSLQHAATQVRDRGGYLLNIAPVSGAQGTLAKIRNFNIEFGPGLRDVQSFTTQLAVMIKAGINVRTAIEGIAKQTDNTKFQRILEQVKSDVESGKPLSEALGRHPKVFKPLYVNMVRASELSGSLGHMLDRIAKYLGQQLETRSMVRGAMIYPAIIGFMAIVVTIFLLTYVLPQFTALFAGKDALLPTPTLMLISLSSFMRNYWYICVGGLLAAGSLLFCGLQTPTGHEYYDRFKLRLPLFRRMFRALYITRGMQTMGELINAGVPVLETLAITAEISGNMLYKRMWMSVHTAVKEGNKIAQPLSRQRLLPGNVVQMIASGEESGRLGEVMQDVAEFYSRELRNTIKAVTAMIEPIMIVMMGALVGFIAMSIILPIFKMTSLVK